MLGVVHALAVDPATAWVSALGRKTDAGSEIAEATITLLGRTVRLIVRRRPKGPRCAARLRRPRRLAAARHHHQRGCRPDDRGRGRGASPAPGRDPGGHHLGVEERLRDDPRPGTAVRRQLAVLAGRRLAHNVGLWLRTLALPRAFRRARGKRLRLGFLNVPARLVRHGRRLQLRFAAAYRHLDAFGAALNRIRALPAFG